MQITREQYARPEWFDSSLFPFESKWLNIDDHVIHYVDEGPRNAQTLLFIHPGAGWSFSYRYQIEEMRNEFRCIALDLPGYGLSRAKDGYNFTLLEQARILESFVLSLDLKDLIVWINDGGGPTAILALAGQAERVRGFVIGGTFG